MATGTAEMRRESCAISVTRIISCLTIGPIGYLKLLPVGSRTQLLMEGGRRVWISAKTDLQSDRFESFVEPTLSDLVQGGSTGLESTDYIL
jgi:hypothetical protein